MAYTQGTDLSLYSAFMKDWYMPEWIDTLTGSTTTWQMFRQDSVQYHGKRMVIPLRTKRNASPTFIARTNVSSGGGMTQLTTPGYQGVDTAFPQPRIFTGSIALPQDTIDQAKTDKGAFYDALDFEMMGLLRDSKEKLDAACYDDGTARIPYSLKYTGSTQVKSVVSVSLFDIKANGSPYIFVGQRIQIFDAAYAANLLQNSNGFGASGTTYGVVVSITSRNADGTVTFRIGDPAAPTTAIQVAGSASGLTTDVAADHIIHEFSTFAYTAGGASHWGNGFRGVTASISDYNPIEAGSPPDPYYLGIDRGASPTPDYWNAGMDKTAPAADTSYAWNAAATGNPALILQKNIDEVHDNSLGEIDLMLMSRWGSRQILALTAGLANPPQGKQQYQNTVKTWMGFQSKDQDKHPGSSDWTLFNEKIPMVVDKFACPYVTAASSGNVQQPIWLLDSSTHYFGMVTDFSWWDVGGIFQPMPGGSGQNYFFGIVANMYMIGDLICDAPNRNRVITQAQVGSN